MLESTIVAVRTFSSVSWRTGVLLPWRRDPVKNSRSGGGNRKSSAADSWQSDRWHNQVIGGSRPQSPATGKVNDRGERPRYCGTPPWSNMAIKVFCFGISGLLLLYFYTWTNLLLTWKWKHRYLSYWVNILLGTLQSFSKWVTNTVTLAAIFKKSYMSLFHTCNVVIYPVLKSLHSLKADECTEYKLLILTYNCVNAKLWSLMWYGIGSFKEHCRRHEMTVFRGNGKDW